ncbi:hypothetical protein K3495_g12773 [Podosphaera aphanis]|nr:hypothetical protein K3495_g12773 [Podosphaera aphanis]
MSKRDFFSIFWEAFEKAFTEKNINSAWEKTENQKLRTLVSSASARTNAATRYLLGQLSNRILEGDAQQTVLLMENERLKEALNKANAKKKRKKTTIEHLRAEDGSGAVFFGPSEIQRYNELNQQKDQEKEQESQEKLRRRQEQAAKKAREEAEKQSKRTIRVAAAEARKKAAAEKKVALASAREGKKV